ncbi:hypothetical protein S7711_09299 [Stachybotrys chartarum IBT 7711]|uniref:Uncharacterized protein n=1 Tax=Stachybotrys chartarum (strain CBS 109288 / IBT 7711) TaxID=1280523 RepID=A0A084BCF3_STACB|nr:hypothetical protein S7711_09299 [Stachybotrys chartarum IBT 7711]
MSSSHGSCSSLAGGAPLAVGPDQRLLLQYGYISRQLFSIELERKKRCLKCTRVLKARDVVVEAGQAKKVPDVQAKCSFHSGRVAYGASLLRFSNHCRKQFSLMSARWNPACCNGHPRSKPCNHQLGHTARHHAPGELTDAWRFYDTP